MEHFVIDLVTEKFLSLNDVQWMEIMKLPRALKVLHQSVANRRERNSNIKDGKKARKKSCDVQSFALSKKFLISLNVKGS